MVMISKDTQRPSYRIFVADQLQSRFIDDIRAVSVWKGLWEKSGLAGIARFSILQSHSPRDMDDNRPWWDLFLSHSMS